MLVVYVYVHAQSMKQEGVDYHKKRARASSCLVRTYNSSNKKQHSVVLLRVLLLLWLYHKYDGGCMMRIICEHAVRFQHVRKYKRPFGYEHAYQTVHYITGQSGASYKNPSYESAARSFVSVRRQTWCSIITMADPHQIILQWAGSQALLVVYVLQQHSVVPGTTAAVAVVVLLRSI